MTDSDSAVVHARFEAAQTSLRVAALLAAAGGFFDAFTYLGHGGVFANAMTGNVVLLGLYATTGHVAQALRHVWPILAFVIGVAVSQALRLPRARAALPYSAVAALGIEIAFLLIGGCLPWNFPDLPIVLGVSFLAALQSSTFARVEKWAYNSTMTTGNLRQLAESVFKYLIDPADRESWRHIRPFAVICLGFLAGAMAGGFCTKWLNNKALWPATLILFAVWLPLARAARRQHAGASSV